MNYPRRWSKTFLLKKMAFGIISYTLFESQPTSNMESCKGLTYGQVCHMKQEYFFSWPNMQWFCWLNALACVCSHHWRCLPISRGNKTAPTQAEEIETSLKTLNGWVKNTFMTNWHNVSSSWCSSVYVQTAFCVSTAVQHRRLHRYFSLRRVYTTKDSPMAKLSYVLCTYCFPSI